MKRCIAAVLLVLSLEALAAGRLSATVADDHVDTIRLPSNDLADEVATAATEIGAEKTRPWKCCDRPLCSSCTNPDADDIATGPGVSGPPVAVATEEEVVSEESAVVGTEKPRPWKCCDDTLCTRSAPPTCACNDKVKKCAKTCKKCDKDESDASRFVCRDRYFGWPGPKCTEI
ncbi:unnamed protein product [Triticum turgidum subsp. durum]|uniref:Bowman-Birk serine protease inhibitors family domain-containing protein n=1 Tax=Triticum turgidum subsp. durum TaxID=4567 RepID=A0A9R1Q634_TRITD|nr:unnamed protein product [Triticum turgidum subsp. durum]